MKANPMRKVRIEKLTLNVGAGTDQEKLKKGMKLLKNITGIEPLKTLSDKRIPTWGVRPGLPVGCKITIRGKQAEDILKRLLKAKDGQLRESCFDENGNISFGIHEYIDIPDLEYDSSIGIMGFQVTITLSRPGNRIKYRKKLNRKLGKKHKLTKQDSINFFKEEFKVILEEEQ